MENFVTEFNHRKARVWLLNVAGRSHLAKNNATTCYSTFESHTRGSHTALWLNNNQIGSIGIQVIFSISWKVKFWTYTVSTWHTRTRTRTRKHKHSWGCNQGPSNNIKDKSSGYQHSPSVSLLSLLLSLPHPSLLPSPSPIYISTTSGPSTWDPEWDNRWRRWGKREVRNTVSGR